MTKSTRRSIVLVGTCLLGISGCSDTDSKGTAVGGNNSGVAGNTSLTSGGSAAQGGATGSSTSSFGNATSVNCDGTAGSSSCPEAVTAMCGMLDAHNQARADAPGANPPIPALVWDCSIAATAQAYADACPEGHSNNGSYGENMFWSSGSQPQSPTAAVAAWLDEGPPNYVYASNSCNGAVHSNANFNCGHYTQVVWRDTTRLGCGFKTGCPGQLGQVWVCNYSPPGNFGNQTTGVIKTPY